MAGNTRTLDNNTRASDPGQFRLSHEKLREFHPELYERKGLMGVLNLPTPDQKLKLTHIEEHLLHGDSRAALVIHPAPLVIAAYTDEMDCVALLRFPDHLTQRYGLQAGSRLLTVNTYARGQQLVPDLEHGPASYHRWINFSPFIAEFLSEDIMRIGHRKAEIEEAEWARAWAMAGAYVSTRGWLCRDGRPLLSSTPASIRL